MIGGDWQTALTALGFAAARVLRGMTRKRARDYSQCSDIKRAVRSDVEGFVFTASGARDLDGHNRPARSRRSAGGSDDQRCVWILEANRGQRRDRWESARVHDCSSVRRAVR